jgi:molecular chaperone GrpE
MKINEQKFNVFLEVAREVNINFDTAPILYGSLGLAKIIGEVDEVNDIDILIPEKYLIDRWEDIIEMMKKTGFKLVNEKEHEFLRGKEKVAFGKEDDLKEMAEIDSLDLPVTNLESVKFRELNAEQYLRVYKLMLRDNYRQEKRKKNDQEKIERIEKFLRSQKNNLSEERKEDPDDKLKEYFDGWKRCQADFENYRKMQAESGKELMNFATENLVLQMLPILDNFHASTDHVPEDQKDNAWVTGIMHIQKQLETFLKDNGVDEVEAKIGDNFNPELHEALPGEKEVKKNKIAKIISKGYKINHKIIRAVKVIVE